MNSKDHFVKAQDLLQRADNVSQPDIKSALSLQAIAEIYCARFIFDCHKALVDGVDG